MMRIIFCVFIFLFFSNAYSTELQLYRGENLNDGKFIRHPSTSGAGLILSPQARNQLNRQIVAAGGVATFTGRSLYRAALTIVNGLKNMDTYMTHWCRYAPPHMPRNVNTGTLIRNAVIHGHIDAHSFNYHVPPDDASYDSAVDGYDSSYDENDCSETRLFRESFHGSPWVSTTANSQVAFKYAANGSGVLTQANKIVELVAQSHEAVSAVGFGVSSSGRAEDMLNYIPSALGIGRGVSEAEFLILGGVEVKNVYDPVSAFFQTSTPFTIRDYVLNHPNIQYAGDALRASRDTNFDSGAANGLLDAINNYIFPELYSDNFQSMMNTSPLNLAL